MAIKGQGMLGEIINLRKENDALRAALRGVEWGGTSYWNGHEEDICPACHEHNVHRETCLLAAALAMGVDRED